MKSTIFLPRLIGAIPEQQQQFEKYLHALTEHELGHYQIASAAVTEIDSQLSLLPDLADCINLRKLAHETGNTALDNYKSKEKLYDAHTKHGESQGAWLKDR